MVVFPVKTFFCCCTELHIASLCAGKRPAAFRKHPRYLSAGIRVVHITETVHCHDCTDLQISDLHGVCTEPALHQALDAQKLPDCSACPRTAVSLLRLVFLRVCACRVSHLSIRSAVKIPCDQIVKTRCRHYGNDACPDVKSYAFFLEITHHSTGRVESVSAAARKQHAVYFLTCL